MNVLEYFDKNTGIHWKIKREEDGFSLWKDDEWKGTWVEVSDILDCAVSVFDND